MVTAKLAALQFYQLAIPPPIPPEGSFDRAAAARGEMIFNGKATCSQCHVPPLFTEPGWNTHKASEINFKKLSLTEQEKTDLVDLKSL